MAMTAERLAVLRQAQVNCRLSNPGWIGDALNECLDEIARLQAIKPMPTREQATAALKKNFTKLLRDDIVDALSSANLLQEPEREPGHYWCRWRGCWWVYQWDGSTWDYRGEKPIWKPDHIGPRIPDPPSTP